MNHIFISCDPAIKTTIEPLIDNLKLCSLNITANDSNETSMKTKSLIDNSSIFMCFITKDYSKDDICMQEVDYAFQTQKPVALLMYENVPIKDLDHLGYLIAGQKVLNVFEDREKQYLNGEGIYFEQIFSKLKETFKNEYEVAQR